MPQATALLPLLAPAVLLAAAAVARREPGLRPARALRAAQAATTLAVTTALGCAGAVAWLGAATSPLLGVAGFGLAIRLDALSATMLVLVSFVGMVVARFSRNYLDGDARQGVFSADLCRTLAAVSLLVTAGNLALLLLAWIGTSLALHRLLLFRAERAAAVAAAHKKFLCARAGDACLAVATVLLATTYGSGDLAAIADAARSGHAPPALAGVLIALAALLKSAQFPAHGWLIEVMETPTPVSALLHAGIVNAGGFLVVRLADVLLAVPGALAVLALAGGITALLAGVVMLTQASIKASLAWSTVAQMGFMLLQCGLGAFTSAVLHIVAHSLYKAHAFLAAGSAADAAALAPPLPRRAPGAGRAVASLAAALAIVVAAGAALGFGFDDKPVVVALGAVLVLGLAQYLLGALEPPLDRRVLALAAGAVVLVSAAYFALQAAAAAMLSGAVPPLSAPEGSTLVLAALVVAAFATVSLLQMVGPPRGLQPVAHTAWVLAGNGLYANACLDRIAGSLRRAGMPATEPAPARSMMAQERP